MISKNQINNIQSLHLKKNRDLRKLFLVEGIKTIEELLNYRPNIILQLFATEDFIAFNLQKLTFNNVNYTLVSDVELSKISLQNTPNKALAVCNYFYAEEDTINFDKNFSLYLDDIRDPGNFGTILRLANWFGISTIYCSTTSCDFYNPKVIQATMGAFLRINCVYVDLAQLIKTKNIAHIYGAVLNGKNIYKQSLKTGLIVIGNEANGISSDNLKLINQPITIPCHTSNGNESLNAAMATSIITAEFYRQLVL